MQPTALTLMALASSSLAQTQGPPGFGNRFGISASGQGINNVQVTAQGGRLFIGGTQTPSCEGGKKETAATFVLYTDKSLWLYKNSQPPQQVWVDASGMGGGISGFTETGPHGKDTAPKNASRDGFATDKDGVLTLHGVGAKACPTQEAGKWTIWFSNSAKPANAEGCVDVKLDAFAAPERAACTYTTQ